VAGHADPNSLLSRELFQTEDAFFIFGIFQVEASCTMA
jgi:hypothetical protein